MLDEDELADTVRSDTVESDTQTFIEEPGLTRTIAMHSISGRTPTPPSPNSLNKSRSILYNPRLNRQRPAQTYDSSRSPTPVPEDASMPSEVVGQEDTLSVRHDDPETSSYSIPIRELAPQTVSQSNSGFFPAVSASPSTVSVLLPTASLRPSSDTNEQKKGSCCGCIII